MKNILFLAGLALSTNAASLKKDLKEKQATNLAQVDS